MFRFGYLAAFIACLLLSSTAWAANNYTSGLTDVGTVGSADTFPDCVSNACNATTPMKSATVVEFGNLIATLPLTFSNKTFNGGVFSGTFTGSPTLSGNPIFSGVPVFSGLTTGTCANDIQLNASGQSILGPCSPAPLASQAVSSSCTVNTSCFSSNDSPFILTVSAPGIVFTLPAPGGVGSGGFTFTSPWAISYTISTGSSVVLKGCGPNASSVVLSNAAQVLTDGVNYLCFANNTGALVSATVTNAASISLPGIPAADRNIDLDCNVVPITNAVGLRVQFNGDTNAANYSTTGTYTIFKSATVGVIGGTGVNVAGIVLDDGNVLNSTSNFAHESVHVTLRPAMGTVNGGLLGETAWQENSGGGGVPARANLAGADFALPGAITSLLIFYTGGSNITGTCTASYGPAW